MYLNLQGKKHKWHIKKTRQNSSNFQAEILKARRALELMYPTKLCAIFENKEKLSMIWVPKSSTKKNLEKIYNFSNVAEYRISLQKSMAFLYNKKIFRDLLVSTMAFCLLNFCSISHLQSSNSMPCWTWPLFLWVQVMGGMQNNRISEKKSYRSQLNIYYLKLYRKTYSLIQREYIWDLPIWVDNTPCKSHR